MSNEELVAQYQSGRKEALAELYTQNRRFIYKYARKYSGADSFLQDDLAQEAFFALATAAERYREDVGVYFLVYASRYIKKAMLRYVEDKASAVRLPAFANQELRNLAKAEKALGHALGRPATNQELASVLGVSVGIIEDRKRIRHQFSSIASTDSFLGDEEDCNTLEDMLPADGDLEEEVLQDYDREQLVKELQQVINSLPEEQQKALRGVFWEGKACRDCGRSAYSAAVQKLRRNYGNNPILRGYYDNYIVEFVRHVSLAEFLNTGMSEQEAAFERMERSLQPRTISK